ncbi:MAG: CBS domain-containing protein [Armatimonadota bacterium]
MPGLFFSNLINSQVIGKAGEPIGHLVDILVHMDERYPPLIGLIVRLARQHEVFIHATRIKILTDTMVVLNTSTLNTQPFQRRPNELLMGEDLLDKQIVNVNGQKVVRVNDLLLEHVRRWRLVAVDVSMAALVARIGLPSLANSRMRREVIPWDGISLFASDMPVPISLKHEKLATLHPAEISDILEELSYPQGQELLASFDAEMAADVVETMEPSMRRSILSAMDKERATEILAEMEPDEVADALGELPPETAGELLEHMEPDQAFEVSTLLNYPPESAGGHMTTDFFTLGQHLTVKDALLMLRETEDLPNFLSYIYVTDRPNSRSLCGVVSLRRLVCSQSETVLKDIMEADLQVRRIEDEIDDVARVMAQYNLLAIPVMDDSNQIAGIVTFDDAMEDLLPEIWHKLPRITG